ncbi:MAG: hypothetical protein HWE25_04430 [Alphaproteobacteria bacterium]|nr:hypothetical protein [Alphaproteobacteria bacterium]
MMKRAFTAIAGLFLLATSVQAEEYWITQYRAAPGKFPALLELVKNTDLTFYSGTSPILMRHSQGNHWDLMVVQKFNPDCRRSEPCINMAASFNYEVSQLVDFELNFVALSETDWATLQQLNENTGLYHIEMFNAAAGKHDALLRQRRIENDYLARTGQVTNVIFTVDMGSDIDVFTIGFHESLKTFAESPDLPPEAFEKAAVDAGFKNRADISFHLRELIVGHHDTLAGPVK